MTQTAHEIIGSETASFPISVGDASKLLKELAEPSSRGDRIKATVTRVSRLIGLSYWRTYDIWYAKAHRIEPAEQDQILSALAAKREATARNEIHELRTRLVRLEALLAQGSTDFLRAAPNPVRPSAGGLGRMAGPVAAKA